MSSTPTTATYVLDPAHYPAAYPHSFTITATVELGETTLLSALRVEASERFKFRVGFHGYYAMQRDAIVVQGIGRGSRVVKDGEELGEWDGSDVKGINGFFTM